MRWLEESRPGFKLSNLNARRMTVGSKVAVRHRLEYTLTTNFLPYVHEIHSVGDFAIPPDHQ